MTDNQDTLGMKHVIDLSTVAATSAPSKFQQLINQVQALTQAILATRGQHQTLPYQQILAYDVALSIPTSQP
jgi:hypothetical protein